MLRWLAVAGDGLDESAWARALQISCQLPSLGRLAPPGPVKLPSRTPSGARALISCQPPPAARPLIPSCPLSQELVPLHRRGFDECPKARGGSKRHWELSWRLLGQRAGRHDGRASASAPTAAADGRKVLRDNGGATGVAQTAVRVLRTEIWQRWEQLAPPAHANFGCAADHDTCAPR